MRLCSKRIDDYSFDITMLPDNPQFSELRVYGHSNQLIYSYRFQTSVGWAMPEFKISKHECSTYKYYRLDGSCDIYGFSLILLPLGNDCIRPIYSETWQDVTGTKLRVTVVHDGIRVVRKGNKR